MSIDMSIEVYTVNHHTVCGNRKLAAKSCMHDPIPGVCGSCPFGVFFGGGGLVLFAGLAAGLLAGVATQFIQCGEYRSAVKVTPPQNEHTPCLHHIVRYAHIAKLSMQDRCHQWLPASLHMCRAGCQPGTAHQQLLHPPSSFHCPDG
jgi:hypothetical protein